MLKENYHQELQQKIKELRKELAYRKSRLEYNIIAGVDKKSIQAQRKTIEELKIHIDNIEYVNQHDINDYSQIPQ